MGSPRRKQAKESIQSLRTRQLSRQPTLESQLSPTSKWTSWHRWGKALLPSEEWKEDLIETEIRAATTELADFGISDDEIEATLNRLLRDYARFKSHNGGAALCGNLLRYWVFTPALNKSWIDGYSNAAAIHCMLKASFA